MEHNLKNCPKLDGSWDSIIAMQKWLEGFKQELQEILAENWVPWGVQLGKDQVIKGILGDKEA